MAAPAYVQGFQANSSTAVTSLPCAYPTDVGAGHLLVVFVSYASFTASTASNIGDSLGISWNMALCQTDNYDSSTAMFWGATGTLSGPCTVTFTPPGGSTAWVRVMVLEYNNVNQIDQTGTAYVAVSASISTTINTLHNTEMISAFALWGGGTPSAGTGFVLRTDCTSLTLTPEDNLTATTAGPYTVGYTCTQAHHCRLIAASFYFMPLLQTVRPDADTTTTGWTTTPLWSKVNDDSDSTVVTATIA